MKLSIVIPATIAHLAMNSVALAASLGHPENATIHTSTAQNQTLPASRGKTGNRGSGGRRSVCNLATKTTNKDLYALVPASPAETYTADERPALWFYIPYTSTQSIPAQLILKGENSAVASYARTIALSGTPGIIGVRLPQSLQPGQSYNWYLTIQCDSLTESISVHGWIQRSQLSSAVLKQINDKSLSLKQLLKLYQQHNLWSDRLMLLATQVNKNPEARAEWNALLKEIGLGNLQSEAILGFYTIK